MDYDTPPANGGFGYVVIDHCLAVRWIPDFNPELIDPALNPPVHRGELKLEFRMPFGHGRSFFILGHEPEVRFAGQGWIADQRSCRRFNPAAAGDKASARVIDDHEVFELRRAAATIIISDGERHGVNA